MDGPLYNCNSRSAIASGKGKLSHLFGRLCGKRPVNLNKFGHSPQRDGSKCSWLHAMAESHRFPIRAIGNFIYLLISFLFGSFSKFDKIIHPLFSMSKIPQLSLLMRFRIPSLNDLKRTFWGIVQSTCFLTTNGYTYSLMLCILRHYVGSFNFYTASFIPSIISSAIALTIERPTRRGLLCLYVSNVATETLFNMACSRGYCRPIPYGQVLIFGASISVLLYYFRSGLHQRKLPIKRGSSSSTTTVATTAGHQTTQKDSIYDILRFVIGRYEEHVPALQLQPQFLSRRRERQASAPVLMTGHQPLADSDTTVGHLPAAGAAAAAASQRRQQQRNPLLPYVLRAVRYYTQAMDYFKYSLPRHKTCPHPRDSCVHYVVSGGAKMFTLGVGLQVGVLVPVFPFRNDIHAFRFFLRLLSFSDRIGHTNIDQTENGFEETVFRSTEIDVQQFEYAEIGCLFRRFLHHIPSKQTHFVVNSQSLLINSLHLSLQLTSCSLRHIFGNDDPLYSVPAAFLASIAFANYPDTTVALYVFWKALQVS